MVEAKTSLAGQFDCRVVSPEKPYFSGMETAIQIPAEKGDAVILPGHAPMVFHLLPGLVRLQSGEKGNNKDFFITGGFAEVNNETVVVLADAVVPVSSLDNGVLQVEMAGITQAIELAETEADINVLQDELAFVLSKIEALAKSQTAFKL